MINTRTDSLTCSARHNGSTYKEVLKLSNNVYSSSLNSVHTNIHTYTPVITDLIRKKKYTKHP